MGKRCQANRRHLEACPASRTCGETLRFLAGSVQAFVLRCQRPQRLFSSMKKACVFAGKPRFPKERKTMKTTILRLILAALLLVASGSTPVLADGGGEPPLCFPGPPGCPKATGPLPDGPGEPPLCFPGQPGCPG